MKHILKIYGQRAGRQVLEYDGPIPEKCAINARSFLRKLNEKRIPKKEDK